MTLLWRYFPVPQTHCIRPSSIGRWHWPSDIAGGWLLAAAYAWWTLPFVRASRP